jgi:subfamily B ATP-binding cassette protein MsbA
MAAQERNLYVRSLSYFRADWALILLLFILTGAAVLLALLQSWPLAIIIDAVLTDRPKSGGIYWFFLAPFPRNKVWQVTGVALIGMLMKVVQDLLTGARTLLNNRINNYGVMRVRDELYEKFCGSGGGDAMYRVESDSQGPQVIFNVLLGAIFSLLTFLTTAAIMLTRSVSLTVFAVCVAPPLIWINLRFGAVLRRRTTDAKEFESRMVSILSVPKEAVEFRQSAKIVADKWLGLNWAQETYWFLVRGVFSLFGAVVFGYGGYLVYRDQFVHPIANGMTVGTLAVFMDYLGKMWDPLTRLTGAGADIQPGVAGAKRVFEVLDSDLVSCPPMPGSGTGAPATPPVS